MKTSDKDSVIIAKTLENDYFNGIYNGNVEQLRKVYHPGTLLWGDVKGQPYAKTLAEYLDGVAHRQSPPRVFLCESEITRIEIFGRNTPNFAEVITPQHLIDELTFACKPFRLPHFFQL